MTTFERQPIPWKSVSVSLIPGLIVVLQNLDIWHRIPRPLFILFPLLFLITMIVITLVLIGKEKGLSSVCLPAIGGLLWELDFVLFWYLNSPNNYLIDLLLVVSTLGCMIYAYKLNLKISKSALQFFAGFAVALMLITFLGIAKPANWLSFFTGVMFAWITKVVPVLALGLIFMQSRYFSLGLLVAVIEPIWIESYLRLGEIDYMAQSSSAISIQVVLSIFRITPLLVFLILIPAIEFRTVGQNRYLWLALSSLVVIGAMVYVRIEFLHDPETIFVLPKFMMWLFYVILLWTPIILSIVLFPVKPLVFMKN